MGTINSNRVLRLFLLSLHLLVGRAFGQVAEIAISGPLTGVALSPGQTISAAVTVTGVKNTPFTVTAIGPCDPPPPSQTGLGPTFTFSCTIAADTDPGVFPLNAFAIYPVGSSAATANAVPLRITVESAQVITALTTNTSKLSLRFPGDQRYVRVMGTPSVGTEVSLKESSRLAIVSMDQKVAIVGPSNVITATGPGTTTIQVSYSNSPNQDPSSVKATVVVSVPSLVPGDLDGNGVVDQYDLSILQMWLNHSATGSFDARDLNHDGKIDALDARILTTLCTHPRCAVQ